MTDLRYPVGKFQRQESITETQREQYIREIAEAPAKLRSAVAGVSEAQISTPYREGGWTVKQVVHHLPDSHLNAYIRFKLALTEQQPNIKTYHENLWAELHDARNAPIETSLTLLESLHTRWVMFLKSSKPEDFDRTFNHPDNGIMKIHALLQMYA